MNKQAFRTVSLTQRVTSTLPMLPMCPQPYHTLQMALKLLDWRCQSGKWHSCAFNILFHVRGIKHAHQHGSFLSWLSFTKSQLTLNDVFSSICSFFPCQVMKPNDLGKICVHARATPNILLFKLWGIKRFWFVASFILEKNTTSFLS